MLWGDAYQKGLFRTGALLCALFSAAHASLNKLLKRWHLHFVLPSGFLEVSSVRMNTNSALEDSSAGVRFCITQENHLEPAGSPVRRVRV